MIRRTESYFAAGRGRSLFRRAWLPPEPQRLLVLVHGYAEHGPPHELWTRLRAESPVHYCEPTDFEPFWAVTKYADIFEISTHPERFLSEPGSPS